jgi:chorismate mutase
MLLNRARTGVVLAIVLCATGTTRDTMAQFGGPFGEPLEIDHIRQRIAELNPIDRNLPDDAIVLYEERQSIAEEVAQLRQMTGTSVAVDNVVTVQRARTGADESIATLLRLDCQRQTQDALSAIAQIQRVMRPLGRIVFLFDLEMIANPWEEVPDLSDQSSKSNICIEWKQFIAQPGKRRELIAYFDSLETHLSSRARRAAETKEQAVVLLELLQKRKQAVDAKLAKGAAKTTYTDKLWIALIVIGVFSIGAIAAVKLFDEPIQVEWVASGQVIQFVTVMILLSVVMALGLAGILTENTLGTLLGGIAGYVLAQGVGRAAAREVTRGVAGASAARGDAPRIRPPNSGGAPPDGA